MKKINFLKSAKEASRLMIAIEQYLKETTISPLMQELVKIRVSQINGCVVCLDSHTKKALQLGERAQRIFLISAWRETSIFTDKEKAAFELAEQLTHISMLTLDDNVYDLVTEHFTEEEFLDLIVLINQINSWNRVNIATRNDVNIV